MVFRSYTNVFSRTSRGVATGIFIAGLILVGFGFMIYLLPRLFATLAALVFFVAGIGCTITAVKIFWAAKKIDDAGPNGSNDGRRNVRVREEQYYEQ